MHMAPHQMIQQTPHGQIVVSGSQPPPQLSTTPGGLVTTPPPMMLTQSGMSMSTQAPPPGAGHGGGVAPGGMYPHLQVTGVMPQVAQNQGKEEEEGWERCDYFKISTALAQGRFLQQPPN